MNAEQIKIIEPSRGWLSLNLGEVWRYRELLQLLVWRDTIVRYKQSIVGIGWALIKPLSTLFSGLVDFCISFIILVGMMVWYRSAITVTWMASPACMTKFAAVFLSRSPGESESRQENQNGVELSLLDFCWR